MSNKGLYVHIYGIRNDRKETDIFRNGVRKNVSDGVKNVVFRRDNRKDEGVDRNILYGKVRMGRSKGRKEDTDINVNV